MIDMHSHILPGIDDGAQSLDESLQMLRIAAAEGVTAQVLTPHIHIGRYPNTKASLTEAFSAFRGAVDNAGIGIALELAAEVRIGAELLQLAQNDGIPWLGVWEGKNVFLMEFPHHQVPVGSINLVDWLLQRDIVPMIAHPERNRELQVNPKKLVPFLEAGCLTQITSGSLVGQFGVPAHRLAVTLLTSGLVTLLATDCHNLDYRPPNLSAGFSAAAELIGDQAATDLVITNPTRLLQAA